MQNNEHAIVANHNQIRTEVVTTDQQLLHAYAIRSICFMEEHGVKATQTFDGNDYQATHIIVYAGDEPIGTMRIRWFRDFAKLERTAFREAYRNTHLLKASAYFVFDSHRPQGIRQGHHPRAAEICAAENHSRIQECRRQGAVLLRRSPEPYIELVKELTPPLTQSRQARHGRLFRTEGSGMRRRSTRRSA